MKQTVVSAPCFSFLSGFVSAGLGVILIVWPALAANHCVMRQLKGKIYTNLPKDLCPRYTDMLLGHTTQQKEYGGVICDRPEASYILLQRLVKQSEQGKAVWQIIEVKSVVKPNPRSLILGVGCQEQRQATSQVVTTRSTEPIFALVQPTPKHTYQTLMAWKVSLDQESFSDLKPQQVICKSLLL
jgi:hypothetical protein